MDEKPRGNVSGRGTNAARIHKRCHQLYSEKGDAVMTNVSWIVHSNESNENVDFTVNEVILHEVDTCHRRRAIFKALHIPSHTT
jgi:hypothetical protein